MSAINEDTVVALDIKENKNVKFVVGKDIVETAMDVLFSEPKILNLYLETETKVVKNYSEILEYKIKEWEFDTIELDPKLYPLEYMNLYIEMCKNNQNNINLMVKDGVILNLGENEKLLDKLFEDSVKFKLFTEFVNRLGHETILYFISIYIAWNFDRLYEKYNIESDDSSSDSD